MSKILATKVVLVFLSIACVCTALMCASVQVQAEQLTEEGQNILLDLEKQEGRNVLAPILRAENMFCAGNDVFIGIFIDALRTPVVGVRWVRAKEEV